MSYGAKRSRDFDAPQPRREPTGATMAPIDTDSPSLQFHRECLIGDYWHVIREEFRQQYEDMFQSGTYRGIASGNRHVSTIREPKKFWRHCREALGKWVLSQMARYQPTTLLDPDATEKHPVADYRRLSSVHFFPTSDALKWIADEKGVSEADASSWRTFDDQLIRDLTIKSVDSSMSEPGFVADVAAFVKQFGLGRRCVEAAAEIEQEVQSLLEQRRSSKILSPSVRFLGPNDKRNAVQQRMSGDLVEIGVAWPDGFVTGAAMASDSKKFGRPQNNVLPVTIPKAAWDKLRAAYECFGAKGDQKKYGGTCDVNFLLRAASIAMRYEHCLASGSLQLCADSALKRVLHQSGYNVLDLCASPINAYMLGKPSPTEVIEDGQAPSSHTVVPRRFCSAFWDTDRYFGSMGSALLFNPWKSMQRFLRQDRADGIAAHLYVEESAPLLLTLDVPYDEDLCELLFLKLARDCVEASSTTASSTDGTHDDRRVEYLLVLPLWWRVPLECTKYYISKSLVGDPQDPTAAQREVTTVVDTSTATPTEAKRMWDLIDTHDAYRRKGFVISYEWMQALATATKGGRAVFDAVFVSDSYQYFCTVANRLITGVTSTEVIGVSLDRDVTAAQAVDFGAVLKKFYKV